MMDLFSSLAQIGPMVEELTPRVEQGMTDIMRTAEALEHIAETLDKMLVLMADYVNYSHAVPGSAGDGAGASVEAYRG